VEQQVIQNERQQLEIDDLQQRLKQSECDRKELEVQLGELQTQKAEADSRAHKADDELKTLSEKVAAILYVTDSLSKLFLQQKISEGNF
jgi:chromosome segregation ATPase